MRDVFFYQESEKKFKKTLDELAKEELQQVRREHEAEAHRGQDDLEFKSYYRSYEEEEERESEEEDDSEFSDDIEKPGFNNVYDYMANNNYRKVLQKIVNQPSQKYDAPRNANERKEVIDAFIKNSRNMFDMYYARAAAKDSLNGLTDDKLVDAVAARPSRLKRKSKKLLKFLAKHNVGLTTEGEVDYSKVKNPNIVKKLKENPFVKIVLMQNDLGFEIPHKEIQMKRAQELQAERDQYKVKLEEIIESMKEKEEVNPFEIATDDSPFHQQLGVKYPMVEPVPIPKPKKRKIKGDINQEEILSTEATYRIFEEYDERMARIEKKWLEQRMASGEGGMDKLSKDQKAELLQKAVQKLRRVKFLIDQKNLENA